jgi:adenylate cyclase class IV
LKLREIDRATGNRAEVIWYQRPNVIGYRGSDYSVVPVGDAAGIKAALSGACGVRGVVRKEREVWLYDNVRIHLDRIEELGSFVEFEAVMSESEDEAASLSRLDRLCAALGVREQDRVAQSYADLVLACK